MPTSSPLSQPLDLVLHIGTGKTGTSSVQFFLQNNRERLSQLGVLYPKTPGGARHARLGLFVKTDAELDIAPEWGRQKQSDPAVFRKTFRRRLLSEIERSGIYRVLLSDEVLFGSSRPALRRLRRFTDRTAQSVRLVVYLRRQDDHMVSRYQQGVKIGWVLRLSQWAQEDMSGLYDYGARLHTWQRLLQPTDIVVRRFESESFVDGSIYQDFLEAVGIDARAVDLEPVSSRNESLDAESVEFLRLLNLYRVEHEDATAGLIDNRRLITRLAEASSGPTLTMPTPFLDGFMAQWEKSNQRVARQFLGDPSGQLFLPRKTRNTTTEQHLDPARLDHFLTLAEVPEHMHAPLRALAEREAKVR
ncbi:MAG TPA: hypothetical protein VNP20_16570 [Nocardioidaceae bacterium]|nr:hypothetical protein [Nocardioidaceae bacterium]